MNYSQIIRATPAVGELKKMRLPYSKARDIHKLHRVLETEFQFFVQEEAKLIKEHSAKVSGGRVTFDTVEAKSKYEERIAELGATDAEIEIPCIVLTGAEIGNELISAETIGALDGIITFE